MRYNSKVDIRGLIGAIKSTLRISFLILLAIVITLVVTELFFRACLHLGVAKVATATYSEEPYGYYFWGREGGHPTGFNNRYGFADQDYEPRKARDTTRIAIIGDSFVEALQVPIDEKMGPVLQSQLNDATTGSYEVISFGRSGEYPAYYLERLKQAVTRFQATTAFVIFYMGNDFRNASLEIERNTSGMRPDHYIFYEIDRQSGAVRPHPESMSLLQSFDQEEVARWGHRPSFLHWIDLGLHRVFLIYSEIPAKIKLVQAKIRAPHTGTSEVVNPRFEEGVRGWMAGNNAKLKVTQSEGRPWLSVANLRAGNNGYAQQSVEVEPGIQYKFELRLRKGEGRPRPTVYVGEGHMIDKYVAYTVESPGEKTYSQTFVATGTKVIIILQVGVDTSDASANFSNLSLKKMKTPALPPVCLEESIFINTREGCWTDSVAITGKLIAEMKQFAKEHGVRLYFLGIPANETFWGDETIIATGQSLGQKMPKARYPNRLAATFAVPLAEVDLQRPNKMLRQVMDENGANYIDLMDSFRRHGIYSRRSPYSRWYNGHLSRDGHLQVAKEMKQLMDPALDTRP